MPGALRKPGMPGRGFPLLCRVALAKPAAGVSEVLGRVERWWHDGEAAGVVEGVWSWAMRYLATDGSVERCAGEMRFGIPCPFLSEEGWELTVRSGAVAYVLEDTDPAWVTLHTRLELESVPSEPRDAVRWVTIRLPCPAGQTGTELLVSVGRLLQARARDLNTVRARSEAVRGEALVGGIRLAGTLALRVACTAFDGTMHRFEGRTSWDVFLPLAGCVPGDEVRWEARPGEPEARLAAGGWWMLLAIPLTVRVRRLSVGWREVACTRRGSGLPRALVAAEQLVTRKSSSTLLELPLELPPGWRALRFIPEAGPALARVLSGRVLVEARVGGQLLAEGDGVLRRLSVARRWETVLGVPEAKRGMRARPRLQLEGMGVPRSTVRLVVSVQLEVSRSRLLPLLVEEAQGSGVSCLLPRLIARLRRRTVRRIFVRRPVSAATGLNASGTLRSRGAWVTAGGVLVGGWLRVELAAADPLGRASRWETRRRVEVHLPGPAPGPGGVALGRVRLVGERWEAVPGGVRGWLVVEAQALLLRETPLRLRSKGTGAPTRLRTAARLRERGELSVPVRWQPPAAEGGLTARVREIRGTAGRGFVLVQGRLRWEALHWWREAPFNLRLPVETARPGMRVCLRTRAAKTGPAAEGWECLLAVEYRLWDLVIRPDD
ncbi:MAG: hypothetical protein M0031_08905 [Thermaerobacter sp.]|nr:hypothetical protein [Thermaerobacter sp.]